MVAEAGLEPTTSGLWVDITLLDIRKTHSNDRDVCVYRCGKLGVSGRIWSWKPALGSKWGQNFWVKCDGSRKWIIQKQLCKIELSGNGTYMINGLLLLFMLLILCMSIYYRNEQHQRLTLIKHWPCSCRFGSTKSFLTWPPFTRMNPFTKPSS